MRLLLLPLFLFAAFSANAFLVEDKLDDQIQEARAKNLFLQLRCVVCAGQSIGDSDADLAEGLRSLVRKKVAEGYSDEEVLSYISDRYGDEILLAPPFKFSTMLLWAGPFIFLIFGFLIIVSYFKKPAKKQ